MSSLFAPITIKGFTLKNRLVMPPMATNMATEDGEVTDKHITHYSARAEGGVGLIIIEHTYIAKDGKLSRNQLGIYDDKMIAGFKKLTRAIHVHGAKVVLQMNHGGSKTRREITGKQPTGPSDISIPGDYETPRPLSLLEIKGIVKAFREASRRAIAADFDGIEFHGAHGFLLCQFLSPFVNNRDDGYGSSLEGRLRLPLEAINAVRSEVGEDVPIFYRFGADDLLEGGLTLKDSTAIAPRLEDAGVDVIDVSAGLGVTDLPSGEQGEYVPMAQAIKETVRVPVIGVGNIAEATYADRVIREGRVDLVALGRKLLSTPDFPKQAKKTLNA